MSFDEPIEFIGNDEFDSADLESLTILSTGVSIYADRDDTDVITIDGVGDYDMLRNLPLLSPVGETFLFRKMNFLRFRAEQIRRAAADAPNADAAASIETLLKDAEAVRNHIAECNLRLVISLSRKFATGSTDFDELMSEGNEILLKAISKFYFSRGFRFSTYAVHSVQRHFFRFLQRGQRHRAREMKTPADLLSELPEAEADQVIAEWVQEEQKMGVLVARMSEYLDEREQRIVAGRFGLGGTESQTLRELAGELKMSKERVRQLQLSAIAKLRDGWEDISGDAAAGR